MADDKLDMKWDLKQANMNTLRQSAVEVAVLPVGAVEAHNLHLPEGLDVIHSEYVAKESCRMASLKRGGILCLPAVSYGVDANLMAFPYTVHVRQSVLDAYITEIVRSLFKHKIRKIVLLNGHGGNDFKPLVRQLQYEMEIFVFCCDWWKVGSDVYAQMFGQNDDHAGAMETSVALAICPELVEAQKAGKGRVPAFRFEALNKGWIYTSRDFSKMNKDCAASSGLPASAEKGQRYLELVCGRVSDFLAELAGSAIDHSFPFV